MDWAVVDAVTAAVPAASNVDAVIQQLRTSDLTTTVRQRFWEVALKSRRIESVKWGIAIGGIGLQPDELEPLLALAHHAEFTLYAAHALTREGASEPRYRRKLVDLLAQARGWGVIRLIDYIVLCNELLADASVQREVVVCGMENNDGIPMEVAFTIAKAVDVHRCIAAARDDDRLRRAVSDLMNTLLTESNPLGGIQDLDGWERLYEAWVVFLEQCDPDVKLLEALRSVRSFLGDGAMAWARKEQEQDRIDRLWQEKFSSGVLRDGLDHARDRWIALEFIEEQGLRELLPAVRQAYTKGSDHCTIKVLAKLGNEQDLEALRASIGQLVDLEARKRMPLSTQNVIGPEYKTSLEYGLVVRAMARLATRDAVTAIKQALMDYDPQIRAAGCDAVANLKSDRVDDEIRTAVRSRLKDAPPYVVAAARNAASAHGIKE